MDVASGRVFRKRFSITSKKLKTSNVRDFRIGFPGSDSILQDDRSDLTLLSLMLFTFVKQLILLDCRQQLDPNDVMSLI